MSNIDVTSLTAQLRTLSSKAAGMSPELGISTEKSNFAQTLNNAINQVNQLENDATNFKQSFEMGDSSVRLHDVMIATQKAKIAFGALTEVRNKFVSAYQEIMNMQA